ncbi:ATP-binding cassette domain-containing protein [Hwanghaeella grinnelliae]|uniref:ATP-binding cassette domain-containing protein n=2 Tax=Hwanghaeella grinnelliae TaxID=2500179 RepID=A0A3S2WD61_9PROT|nr:ATP-binding cassette domain-containing protein [Hwanghaeella grinnelliae]
MGAMEIAGLTVRIGNRVLCENLSVSIPPGEIVTLMGPSGSGKSTILSHICGTLDRQFEVSGAIRLAGMDLAALRPEDRKLGILFQEALLFPHLSVWENLAFGLPSGISRKERRHRVEAALADAELDGLADRDPATLSGGQKARAALMRTLLAEPRALLLDEPFSRLDAALRDKIRQFVFDHARKARLPTLLVTHDIADAQSAGGPIVEVEVAGQASQQS